MVVHREKELSELVKRLREAAEANLLHVVLYGSATDQEFREEHSDLNILCVLQEAGGAELTSLQPVGRWWWHMGHPVPLIFTPRELQESADVFAIELLDIKERHRMLWGEDFLRELEVPMSLHRLQVERELRTSVTRLRQAFLRSRRHRGELAELMVASASTFATLFRHSLITLGENPPDSRRQVVERLAVRLGLSLAPFQIVLDLREGKSSVLDLNAEQVFATYLDAVAHVAEEMDHKLAGGS